MRFLTFDLSEDADGVITLEALASTSADQHAAVMAEARQVLDWAWRTFPHTHGPISEGLDWDHDLQVMVEAGGSTDWHSVTLTIAGSPHFVEAFQAVFGPADD